MSTLTKSEVLYYALLDVEDYGPTASLGILLPESERQLMCDNILASYDILLKDPEYLGYSDKRDFYYARKYRGMVKKKEIPPTKLLPPSTVERTKALAARDVVDYFKATERALQKDRKRGLKEILSAYLALSEDPELRPLLKTNKYEHVVNYCKAHNIPRGGAWSGRVTAMEAHIRRVMREGYLNASK